MSKFAQLLHDQLSAPTSLALTLFLTVVVCVATPARAGLITNPGGPNIQLFAEPIVINYVDTTESQRIDLFTTTVLTILDGTQIFSQIVDEGDPEPRVLDAYSAADALLSDDGARFSAPKRDLFETELLFTTTKAPPDLMCSDFANGTPQGASFTQGPVTTTAISGPRTINVGFCLADTFNVFFGQTVSVLSDELDYSVPRATVVTDFYEHTEVFEVDGTTLATTPTSVPEPISAAFLTAGLGGFTLLRSRRRSRTH